MVTETTIATETTASAADDLSAYGESTDADPALVEKALGPVELTDPIVLASIARAEQDLDEATITTAIECYNSTVGGGECETGTGGEVVMGYADGGGLNVWRQVTRMEAILQALTYEDIGTIVFRDAQWSTDPAVPIGDINFMVERGVDFIIGYPDWGVALGDSIKAAEAAGIPYMSYSAGWVGLPEQDGSLIPGEDYLGVVGEDLCSLGESFAGVINEGVGEGTIGVLGGTPGNALSLGWQQCHIPALGEGIDVINPPADENSTTGDTYWANDIARDVVRGMAVHQPGHGRFQLRVRRWPVHRVGWRRNRQHDNRGAHRRADPVLRLGRAEQPELQHLVLRRWQLPVAHRGDRPDDEHRRCRDPGRDRGASRDASGDPGRL